MAIRRRTGDPLYRSSGTLPRSSVSGDDQGEFSYPDRAYNRAGRVLPPFLNRRGMGRSPITAHPRSSSRVSRLNPISPFLPSRLSGVIGEAWVRALSVPSLRRRSRRTQQTKLSALSVRVPTRVKFCLQRKQRREVLFAFRRAGYGGSAPKRSYRRTQNSQYRC